MAQAGHTDPRTRRGSWSTGWLAGQGFTCVPRGHANPQSSVPWQKHDVHNSLTTNFNKTICFVTIKIQFHVLSTDIFALTPRGLWNRRKRCRPPSLRVPNTKRLLIDYTESVKHFLDYLSFLGKGKAATSSSPPPPLTDSVNTRFYSTRSAFALI